MPKRRSSVVPPETPPAKGEHIFNSTYLTDLAIRWKKAIEDGREDEALELLNQIIIGSTQMFERLAQYEGFDSTVDLPTLIMSAQERMLGWLMAWNPKKGKLFSWLSTCAKNAYKSELVKTNTHRRRFHATSDNLEKFFGETDDHVTLKEDANTSVRASLKELTARWGRPQELGAVRFCLDAIAGESHDKLNPGPANLHDRRRTIEGVKYAFGLSPDMAKFFYTWALFALRNAMYERSRARVPFTKQDLFRHAHTYTPLVDLLDIITWDQLKKIIMLMGGQRLKLPTAAQLARQHEDYLMAMEIDKSTLDPEAVETIGRKYNRSVKSAQEVYEEMLTTVDPLRDGEFSVYDDGSSS